MGLVALWYVESWCFWTVGLEKTLESPLDSKEIQPVNPKENQPWLFIERLILKLKLLYFGHLMWRADSLEKTLMLGKIEGRRRSGQQRTRMVRWHHQLNGHESEQTVGDSEGQESLVCYSPQGCKESLSDWTTKVTFLFSLWFFGYIVVGGQKRGG